MDDSFQADVTKVLEKQEKPNNWKPYRSGVLVTGYTFSGIFGIIGHRGHIFRVGEAITETTSNSGWRQPAHCLICDLEISQYTDSEFWQRKATKADVMLCLQRIAEAESRLELARKKLRKVAGL